MYYVFKHIFTVYSRINCKCFDAELLRSEWEVVKRILNFVKVLVEDYDELFEIHYSKRHGI